LRGRGFKPGGRTQPLDEREPRKFSRQGGSRDYEKTPEKSMAGKKKRGDKKIQRKKKQITPEISTNPEKEGKKGYLS